MLPNDPGPGANAGGSSPGPEYPPPLDFSVRSEGQPFFVRGGPGFEWYVTPQGAKLVISFAVAGGPVLFRVLEPHESAQLLEWLLKAAEVRDGG